MRPKSRKVGNNILIGIGGISNSGKTELAKSLRRNFNNEKVAIFCQDDYVFPKVILPEINDHIDWETTDSVDFVKYREAVISATHTNDIVISEGLFGFFDQQLNSLMNYSIFLTLDYKSFYNRKVNDLRWGREPAWYIEHIYNSFLKYSSSYPEGALVIDALQANVNELAMASIEKQCFQESV